MSHRPFNQNEELISLESYKDELLNTDHISNENLKEFFINAKDSIVNTVSGWLPEREDKAYKDAIKGYQKLVKHIATLDNVDMKDIPIIIPDRFKGNLAQFTYDLTMSYDGVVKDLNELLNLMISDVSSGINEAHSGEIPPPSSIVKARQLRNKREALQKKLSTYFKTPISNVNGTLLDVFPKKGDLQNYFSLLSSLEVKIREVKIGDLDKKANELNELISAYVEELSNQNQRTSRTAKELTESLFETSKALEFCGYIQAYTEQLYQTTKTILDGVEQYKK